MSAEEILSVNRLNRALLARQMLLARENITVPKAVERLVAMQAQQARPPFVGLWSRVENFTREDLLKAIHDRKLVRSTLLRGTLHLLTAKDYLMLRATLQPGLTQGMKAILGDRIKNDDIPGLLAEARKFFLEKPRTFTELREAMMRAFPKGDERAMGYTVRTHLPLVIAPDDTEWGFRADADFTVAESWLGQPLAPEEQAQALVLRYLAAFGPATAADVQAWSGLAAMQSVMEALRPKLAVFRDARKRELFDLPKAPRPAEDTPAPVRFIADFDNLILSHKDRARIMADEHRPRVTTKNLLVLPTFLVDGFVAGTWKVERVKKVAVMTVTPFAPLAAATKAELAAEGEPLAKFIERQADKVEIKFVKAAK